MNPLDEFHCKNSNIYYLPLNLTSSGEKVALTQAVERHLPTSASLALDSRKSGSEKHARTWIEWKCIMWKYNITFVCGSVDGCINSDARQLCWCSWESAAIPFLIFLEAFARLSSRTTSGLQTTIKGWWRLRKILQPCGVVPAEEADSRKQLTSIKKQMCPNRSAKQTWPT